MEAMGLLFNMAKRFTDTEIWDKAWFMALSPTLKCLVKYVRDKCDFAGVWSPNWPLAKVYVGDSVNEEMLLQIDGGKQFKKMPNGKINCVDFIAFQYGTLSPKSVVHKKVMEILASHQIPYVYPINRVEPTLKEEEEDKEKEKDKEEERKRAFLKMKEKILADGSFKATMMHSQKIDEKTFDEFYEDFFTTKLQSLEYKKILEEEDCRRNLIFSLPYFKQRKLNPKQNGKSNKYPNKYTGSDQQIDKVTNPDDFRIKPLRPTGTGC